MCNEAFEEEPYTLECVPDQYIMQEMCERVVGDYPWELEDVPDKCKTQDMRERAVGNYPYLLEFVPDKCKTQEMCNKVMKKRPWLLINVSAWFVTLELIKIWHEQEDGESCDDNGETVEWYDGYQKLRAQKAKIEEFLPIACTLIV